MKKAVLGFGISAVAAMALMVGPGKASAAPSSKLAAAIGEISMLNQQGIGIQAAPADIMTTHIKKANGKDLAILVSVECGNFTQTEVKSKGGNKDSSTASASVRMRVRVQDADGNMGYAMPHGTPGASAFPEDAPGIVFCHRSQTLEAALGGVITDDALVLVNAEGQTYQEFIDAGGDPALWVPVDVIIDDSMVTEEEINLVLSTMSANSFNFMYPNLPSGDYTIAVEAWVHTDTTSENGSATASASIGNGSLIVETLQLVNGETGELQ